MNTAGKERSMWRRWAMVVSAVLTIAFLVGWGTAGRYTDLLAKNRVLIQRTPSCYSDKACDRYRELFIADAHADTLLHRDPSEPSTRGHVDLSRLLSGGVDLQVFAMAPFAPSMRAKGGDLCGSRTATNRIAGLFVVTEPFRPRTWFSSYARVMRMIERFNAAVEMERGETGRLIQIFGPEDFDRLQQARSNRKPTVGAMLAVEGFYWASPDPKVLRQQIRELKARGVRMIGFTQRASNLLAGSSEDCDDRAGLSEVGRVTVQEVWRQGMILDLAHASPATIADVAAMARDTLEAGPVLVSHVGVKRTCDRDRNLSDEDARNVARAGGVIGLGFWSYVTCWTLAEQHIDVRRMVVAAFIALYDILNDPAFRQEMGPSFDPLAHIGFGSDFDGATTMPFDTTGIPWLLEGLTSAERDGRRVFDDVAIAKIAGKNLLRIIAQAFDRESGT
jgi:microsomal dipeptidase-like Zn-dependent dipeptidase